MLSIMNKPFEISCCHIDFRIKRFLKSLLHIGPHSVLKNLVPKSTYIDFAANHDHHSNIPPNISKNDARPTLYNTYIMTWFIIKKMNHVMQ